LSWQVLNPIKLTYSQRGNHWHWCWQQKTTAKLKL